MSHHTPLLATVVIGLVLAFIFGAIAQRLRASPLVEAVEEAPVAAAVVAEPPRSPAAVRVLAKPPVRKLAKDLGIKLPGSATKDDVAVPAQSVVKAILAGHAGERIMIGFDSGVNWTLGLPFVRTSPDHGTAYDIAGRGVANPSSMMAALQLARQLAERKGLLTSG